MICEQARFTSTELYLLYGLITIGLISNFLNCFRREQQLSTASERNDYLNDELSSERQSNSVLRKKIENANNKLEDATSQNNYLESLVVRYEQRVFELEEIEVELKEKLILLEECLRVAEWWASMIMASGNLQTIFKLSKNFK